MLDGKINTISALSTALDNVQSYIYIKDRQSRYVYANKYTRELFGCTEETLRSSSDSDFFPPDVAKELREIDLRVLSGESTEAEVVVDDGQSPKRVYHEVKTPIYSNDDSGEIVGVLGVSTDITCQKRIEEEAAKLARTDYLTGLSNRLQLDAILREEIKKRSRFDLPLSIIMLDIDHFKNINDRYGHLVGDNCLIQVAETLRNNVRDTDVVGRWGGEEFLILCIGTEGRGASALAEKLRIKLENTCFPDVSGLTASFGVAAFGEEDSLESLISRVDHALYAAKERGRNRVV